MHQSPLCEFGSRYVGDVDRAHVRINHHAVAVAHQRDRSADLGNCSLAAARPLVRGRTACAAAHAYAGLAGRSSACAEEPRAKQHEKSSCGAMNDRRRTNHTASRASFRLRGCLCMDGAGGERTCASGVTWPMMKPCEPPEKRPSVIRATCQHGWLVHAVLTATARERTPRRSTPPPARTRLLCLAVCGEYYGVQEVPSTRCAQRGVPKSSAAGRAGQEAGSGERAGAYDVS